MAWHAKPIGGYVKTSTEAQDNAGELAQVLYEMGWCAEAIAALLGNGAGESGLNPWRWQEMQDGRPLVPSTNSVWQDRGYGIFQFTPSNKYINNTTASQYADYGYGPNFSNSRGKATDGAAQAAYFGDNVSSDWPKKLYGYYADNFSAIGVDISKWYYTDYENFIQGVDNNGNTLTIAELVGVFELTYERPRDDYAASSYYYRVSEAEWWYEHLPEPGPGPGPGPGPEPEPEFPWWILFKFRGRGLR